MARVQTMTGIASISGRIGNYCFRTMKSSGRVFVHQVSSQKPKVERKAPSEAMVNQRARFAAIAKMVRLMRAEGKVKDTKKLWKIATEAYDAANQL